MLIYPSKDGTESINAAFLIVNDQQSDRRTRQQEFPILGCNVLWALQGLTEQVGVGSKDLGLVWESTK